MDSAGYLLDTHIVSDLIRSPQETTRQRIEAVGAERVFTSAIVACEVRFGARKRGSPRLARQAEAVLGAIEILPLTDAASDAYARFRVALERAGTPIGPNDLLIAAQTATLGMTLVTDNVAEFRRVPKLAVVNWLAPR